MSERGKLASDCGAVFDFDLTFGGDVWEQSALIEESMTESMDDENAFPQTESRTTQPK